MKSAIIDSSVLINFYRLGILSHLEIYFDLIHIPTAVESEFLKGNEVDLSKKLNLLNDLFRRGKFRKCTAYSFEAIEIYQREFQRKNKRKKHEGESEALAQNQELLQANILLLDDIHAREIAKNEAIPIFGTLYLLACLNLHTKSLNYSSALALLKKSRYSPSKEIQAEALNKVKAKLAAGLPLF